MYFVLFLIPGITCLRSSRIYNSPEISSFQYKLRLELAMKVCVQIELKFNSMGLYNLFKPYIIQQMVCT